MPAPDGYELASELEDLEFDFPGVEDPGEPPPRRPCREKVWCDASRHVTWVGTYFKMCPECKQQFDTLYRVYHEILRQKPHLSSLSMSEVFERLWREFQKR